MSKYKNIKVKVDGIEFDSKKEANRYKELKILMRAGEIRSLRLQPRYEVQPAFKDGYGRRHRPITYVADFEYYDLKARKTVVEDVKGFKTDVYKLKKKLFLKKYPKYKFVEV